MLEWLHGSFLDIDWYKPKNRLNGDWTHSNTINCLPENRHWDAGDTRFESGNYLINMRSLDTVMVVSRHSGEITWRVGGTYTALVLSGFRPVQGLRFSVHLGTGATVRKALVIGQFGIAAFLIVASTVVHDQLLFLDSRDVGYDPGNLLTIQVQNRAVKERYPVLRDRLMEDPRVEATATMTRPTAWLPPGTYWWDGQTVPKDFSLLSGDPNLVDVYRMRLLAGRSFDSRNDPADVCLINVSAVADMGLSSPDAALGRTIHWTLDLDSYDEDVQEKTVTVIGVVQDLHWEPMHLEIKPLIIQPDLTRINTIAVRLGRTDLTGTLDYVKSTWDDVITELPLQHEFLEASFEGLYRPRRRVGDIITIFAGMAILLTGIGLFSLSSLLVQQRTRSMAIRKVLGGSVPSLIRLMSHEFTWLVVVGNLIAWPIAYYAVNWWLDDFAYRVEVSELIFLATGMATVLGAWMTVGYQTLRAVLANPVDSLRHE